MNALTSFEIELRDEMIPALEMLKEYIDSVGGCDHSVGLCVCADWAAYNRAKNALGPLPDNVEKRLRVKPSVPTWLSSTND